MSDDNKNSGPEEAIKGVVEDVKGKAKEVVGTVTGRDDLVNEGKAQQDKADAQRRRRQEGSRGGGRPRGRQGRRGAPEGPPVAAKQRRTPSRALGVCRCGSVRGDQRHRGENQQDGCTGAPSHAACAWADAMRRRPAGTRRHPQRHARSDAYRGRHREADGHTRLCRLSCCTPDSPWAVINVSGRTVPTRSPTSGRSSWSR